MATGATCGLNASAVTLLPMWVDCCQHWATGGDLCFIGRHVGVSTLLLAIFHVYILFLRYFIKKKKTLDEKLQY